MHRIMMCLIMFLALLVLSNGIQINEQHQEMIKEAIATFIDDVATCPIVVIPSFPIVNKKWCPDRNMYT